MKKITDNNDIVFNYYALYDVVRFGLILKQILDFANQQVGDLFPKNVLASHRVFLDKMVKLSTENLHKIFETDPKLPFDCSSSQSSIEWLIMQMYDSHKGEDATESSTGQPTHVSKEQPPQCPETPEYSPSRNKYADLLKYNYISKYTSETK